MDKKSLIKRMINCLEEYNEKRREKYLDYIYDEDGVEMEEKYIVNEGDIITLIPKMEVFDIDEKGNTQALQMYGSRKIAYEVWEVLAINSTHIKLKRMTDFSSITKREIMVLKNNYDFSFADDFVKSNKEEKSECR